MNDIIDIQNLVVRERQARVRGMTDELQACFHPDATVTTSWSSGSASNFFAGARDRDALRNRPGAGPIVNRLGPALVHKSSGDRAVVELPSTTTRWIFVSGVEAVLDAYMRLIYRVERRDGVWAISDLTAINEADTLQPVVPGAVIPIDESLLDGARHSYRWMTYTHRLDDVPISDDLYGLDRPEAVAALYDDAFAWAREENG